MIFDIDWKKSEGQWGWKTQEYTRIARPYVVRDHANGVWEREAGVENWYDNGDGDDDLIRIIAEVQDFAENPFKRRHIEYDHGNLFPEGIRVGYKRALWKDIKGDIKGEI